ncbi:NAD(P)H-dependent oxidoreductase [Roseivivax marinus]|uniref:NAD(P)H-dependent oxidoreductase n=1 Tax=Roseivivax marinus TaxID=1379903 RepID=UPI001F049CBF|nr:NAD(P)H-dependent oxidoreductase [Roseivivax marinus]UMA64644.1 NAD(P)H-dependent oxidoreductase [Roseivivax marinus]
MASILVVLGHPDGAGRHYCDGLAQAYAAGARAGGHQVEVIDIGAEAVSFLHSRAEWTGGDPPDFVPAAQAAIRSAEHIVFVYPLWLGSMPAKLKAWLEHVMRPRFVGLEADGRFRRLLRGRSARVIVTMAMPAPAYRFWFGAFSLRSFDRNVLRFVGIAPVRWTLIGGVETSEARRAQALDRVMRLGRAGC